MFSELGQLIFENEAIAKTQDFTMGLEVEMQRIDEKGDFSQSPYPTGIGNEIDNHWITNDLLETMPEVVTPPASHALDAMHYLFAINNALRLALSPGELLWPLSMPPRIPKDRKLMLAQKGPERDAYLANWIDEHSYEEGTQSGAHINLSIDKRVVDMLYPHLQHRFASRIALENHLYSIIAQGFMRYRWILTYLFGASPIAEKDFFKPGEGPTGPIRSIRSSKYGFGMTFTGDYTNVDSYVKRIQDGIATGELINESEFHDGVRLKGEGPMESWSKTGIKYLELRMLDLDPTTSVGIRTNTLRLIRIMASYFIMTMPLRKDQVNRVINNSRMMNDNVAEESPNSACEYSIAAIGFIDRLDLYANQIQLGPEYQEELQNVREKFEFPETTPASKLMKHVKDDSLYDYALKWAKYYQQASLHALRPFRGFENNPTITAEELKKELFYGNWELDSEK